MPLFESSPSPIGQRSKRYGEPIYTYYRDSERPGMVAIRNLLEEWFLEIPQEERLDLQQRFRSPIERQHRSAVFELFLHHLFLRSGFTMEFHPEIPGTTRHPDFLVSRDGQAIFYLEAIAVSNSVLEEAQANRMAQVYDALNNLVSPNFFLGLRVEGAPETPPSGASLRRELGQWLETLDVGAIQQCYVEERYEDVPTYQWEHDGWRIIFDPIPKGETSRANPSVRPIGVTMPARARRLTLDQSLRDGVIAKDRYGRLTLPFFVAIQVIEEFGIDRIDVMNGLFGSEAMAIDAQRQARLGRIPDGAWISTAGPIHRTISGVMAWPKLDPWNFSAFDPFVVHNPYASTPLAADVIPLTQYVVDRERDVLAETPGATIEEILGLPKNWIKDE
jgi:hypothetical protein